MTLSRSVASKAEIKPDKETPTHPAKPQDFEETPGFDVVILFSGGADSVLMVKMAEAFGKIPYCILIDYEQLHIDELRYAQSFLRENEVPFRVVKLHGLGVQSGLTGRGEKGRFEGVPYSKCGRTGAQKV